MLMHNPKRELVPKKPSKRCSTNFRSMSGEDCLASQTLLIQLDTGLSSRAKVLSSQRMMQSLWMMCRNEQTSVGEGSRWVLGPEASKPKVSSHLQTPH